MKTVFILGAGASQRAGVPMMAEFLDRADRIFRTQSHAAAQDVFRAIADLQGVYAKSYLDLDNIESVFGAIEMAQLIGKLADRDRDSIVQLRKNIITLIVETIETTTVFPVREGEVWPVEPYDAFAAMVKTLSEPNRRGRTMPLSFLSFNYDLALDHALAAEGLSVDYGLAEIKGPSYLPLLKLHGSINWGICTECKEIVAFEIADAPIRRPVRSQTMRYALGTNIGLKSHCGKPLSGPPVLVPPTWNKNDYHTDLSKVWQRAAIELSEAENLFIIGYSLPESDAFFRYLFALGSVGATRLKRLWIVNPDRDRQVEGRFRNMIGRGIASKVRFLNDDNGLFMNAIESIERELESELAG